VVTTLRVLGGGKTNSSAQSDTDVPTQPASEAEVGDIPF